MSASENYSDDYNVLMLWDKGDAERCKELFRSFLDDEFISRQRDFFLGRQIDFWTLCHIFDASLDGFGHCLTLGDVIFPLEQLQVNFVRHLRNVHVLGNYARCDGRPNFIADRLADSSVSFLCSWRGNPIGEHSRDFLLAIKGAFDKCAHLHDRGCGIEHDDSSTAHLAYHFMRVEREMIAIGWHDKFINARAYYFDRNLGSDDDLVLIYAMLPLFAKFCLRSNLRCYIYY